jgi:hypothetical protein
MTRWLGWRKSYGDFTLPSPLSCAMSAFVGKVNARSMARLVRP